MQSYIRPLVSELRSLGPDSICALVPQQLKDLKGQSQQQVLQELVLPVLLSILVLPLAISRLVLLLFLSLN